MNKNYFILILVFLLGITSAYAIKSNVHIIVLGNDSPIVHFIEESLGYKQPLFDENIVGKTAPDFNLPKLNGGMLKLSDYKGKLIVLNFWASWCPPCRAEMPAFVGIQKKYKDQGVQFLGIAIEDKNDVDRFLNNEVVINYPTSYGVEQAYDVSTQYGNPDGALPYTLIINPEQQIIESYNGLVNEQMLEKVIKENISL